MPIPYWLPERLEAEMLAYIQRERAKWRKRQAIIDDIKRRCGVITPEKS